MKINENYKVFHTIFHVAYALGNDFREFASGFGLSEMEAKFIFCIADGNKKISDLICFFGKHKSTITQKIKSLEKKKYIKRETSHHDKRERKVVLTESGESLYKKMIQIKKQYRKRVFKNFTQEEEAILLTLLDKLELQKHENIC